MPANSNYSTVLTGTIEERSRTVADNVEQGNAVLYELNKAGNIMTASGGEKIIQEVDLEENGTFMYYTGLEVLDTSESDVISAAQFDWKLAAVQVVMSGLEMDVQNTGEERMFEIAGQRMLNAERTMRNQISTGIYSDGTGSSGKQITGLQKLVHASPTDSETIGGINQQTYTNWQNAENDHNGATSSDIQTFMNDLWLDCTYGNESPNFAVFGRDLFSMYWASLQSNQRFTDPERASAGFRAIEYAGIPVYYENAGITATTGYFLNSNFLHWRPHVNRNMVSLGERTPVNQDGVVIPIGFAGNLTTSGRRYQGVLYDTND